MRVSIVQEWMYPDPDEKCKKSDRKNPLFYIVKLQTGRARFLKVGTTTRTIRARFSDDDYRKYSTVKLVYVAELAHGKDPKAVCEHVEDLTRASLREMGGLTWVYKDRFKYFQLPEKIKVYTNLDTFKEISLR